MPTGFVKRRADGEKIWLYSAKEQTSGKRVRDVRWGDFLKIEDQSADGWSTIAWGTKSYFLRSENITDTRPVEVVFLDVGQGDGCIVVSPETGAAERILIVDAGIGDNMLRFLKWRFGKLKETFRFHAAIVTHPDQDHYGGFQAIFEHDKVEFDRVYHNGITERDTGELFGPTDPTGRFLVDIAETHDDLNTLYSDAAVRGSKKYPKLMHKALTSGRVDRIEMLSTRHGTSHDGRSWVPQFAPPDGRVMTLEILGPVPDLAPNGKVRLRWFGGAIGSNGHDDGKTKNGHSVILRMVMGNLRLLFGGDLNAPAEDYLLRHYSGIAADRPLSEAVPGAATRLAADVMKTCHHGAADVTNEFIQAVHPFAFVVSSGDEESHAHPRPDLLGRLGKLGRGEAPLILCTEILRSTREKGREEDFKRLRDLDKRIDDPATSADDRKAAQKERKELQAHIQRRNVGVYGSITLRSDGANLELSFRLEKPRGKQLWQTYSLRHDVGHGWVLTDTDDH
jgi:beta-lactamase superfamily II metal-dependent hydrolase